jgi:hemoglobin
MTKRDIKDRNDIYVIISDFYKKLLQDEDMKHFFEKFNTEVSLQKHLDILVDFWDNILFYSNTYNKNAMLPHIELSKTKAFQKKHFKLWLDYFHRSVDENFKGENSEIAKNRATSIATVMQLKILNFN